MHRVTIEIVGLDGLNVRTDVQISG